MSPLVFIKAPLLAEGLAALWALVWLLLQVIRRDHKECEWVSTWRILLVKVSVGVEHSLIKVYRVLQLIHMGDSNYFKISMETAIINNWKPLAKSSSHWVYRTVMHFFQWCHHLCRGGLWVGAVIYLTRLLVISFALRVP
jgi:hypothetical protein